MPALPSDPRVLGSVAAVEQALRWYLQEIPDADTPPVSAEEAAALYAALFEEQPWSPQQLDSLLTFGQMMYRVAKLSDEAPLCNVGDVLTALTSTRERGQERPPWVFDPTVNDRFFKKMGFGRTSAGIASIQKRNREGWWAHGQRNRAFIEEVARRTAGRDIAVVLGAGQDFDLPLAELAAIFKRLILVDIDGDSLTKTVARIFPDPGPRSGVDLRVMDLTGINGALVDSLDETIAGSGSPTEVREKVEALCRSYRLAGRPSLLQSADKIDLLISSCVLSQVSWPQRVYARTCFEERFGPLRGEAEQRWVMAWREFELRLQQDHINTIGCAATSAVLTSDVISNQTVSDATGVERLTGRKVLALGVGSLLERVPVFLQAARHEAWEWGRYRPSGGHIEGCRMNVEGVVLEQRKNAL